MARILVVDDEQSMQEFMEILLVREGHEVVCCGSAQQVRQETGYPNLRTSEREPASEGPGRVELYAFDLRAPLPWSRPGVGRSSQD